MPWEFEPFHGGHPHGHNAAPYATYTHSARSLRFSVSAVKRYDIAAADSIMLMVDKARGLIGITPCEATRKGAVPIRSGRSCRSTQYLLSVGQFLAWSGISLETGRYPLVRDEATGYIILDPAKRTTHHRPRS